MPNKLASRPAMRDGLIGFFQRLPTLDEVVRILTHHTRTRFSLTLRGETPHTVVVDLAKKPMQVNVSAGSTPAGVHVAMEVETLHAVLQGTLLPGAALGRREMLIRGSPSAFAKLIPLFDVSPLLYPEHLRHCAISNTIVMNRDSKERAMAQTTLVRLSFPERVLFSALRGAAFGLGYLLGSLRSHVFKRLSLFDLLSAMARGLRKAEPASPHPVSRRAEG